MTTDGRARDPYYVVRDDLARSIDDAQRRARDPGAKSRAARDATRADCQAMEWELDELSRAIAIADGSRGKYKLDDEEIKARKRWVEHARGKVREIVEVLVRRERAEEAEAREANGDGAKSDQGDGERRGNARDVNMGDSTFDDHQQLLVREQDHDLDDISASISRIGRVGLTIGEELASQSKMLEELDDDVSGVNARLAAAHRKMETVLKQSGIRGQLCLIVFLTAILVLLFYVAVNNA